jgi:hypothetical protein
MSTRAGDTLAAMAAVSDGLPLPADPLLPEDPPLLEEPLPKPNGDWPKEPPEPKGELLDEPPEPNGDCPKDEPFEPEEPPDP